MEASLEPEKGEYLLVLSNPGMVTYQDMTLKGVIPVGTYHTLPEAREAKKVLHESGKETGVIHIVKVIE